MENKTIKIAGETIDPGNRKIINLRAATLYTHTPIDTPTHIIHGKKAGPVLLITAAIHGDEINGVEIIRRFLKHKIVNKLNGTIIAIPIMNIHGFISLSRYLPDRRDLNRCFPGSNKGSLAARLANIYTSKILKHCTHAIDLHTGAKHRENLPQIRANLSDKVTQTLSKAFKTPVVIDSNIRDGSLRQAAAELGIPILVYEAGEALRFDEVAIKTGVRGILGVMKHLNMLNTPIKTKVKERPEIKPAIAHSTIWIRAIKSGMVHPKARLGTRVHKGQVIGIITEPNSSDETEIIASHEGIIIGQNNLPLVNEGDALFNLACFNKLRKAKDMVEQFQSQEYDNLN